MTPAADFRRIVGAFVSHSVDFILVGGFAAIIEGVPLSTFDVDVVHARTPENVDRLLAALKQLSAIYFDPAGRTIEPIASNLLGPGHHLLRTNAGRLDVLGHIGNGAGYDALLPETIETEDGGIRFRLLRLEKLIEIKEQVGQDKDLAVLPILRRTLALRRQREAAGN